LHTFEGGVNFHLEVEKRKKKLRKMRPVCNYHNKLWLFCAILSYATTTTTTTTNKQQPGWKDNLLIFFLSGLQKLEQWTKKCTELRGEYVE
jgi:hypothetical protein